MREETIKAVQEMMLKAVLVYGGNPYKAVITVCWTKDHERLIRDLGDEDPAIRFTGNARLPAVNEGPDRANCHSR